LRVLVVDDEEDSRVMAERALRAAGAIVVLAASAEEGYRLAINGQGGAGGQPGAGGEGGAAELQFIVSDIGMPGEDGYSMIQRVRTHRGENDLPAVAMTAFAAPEDKRRALMAGFQAHMAKPIDPHDLIAVVAGLIDGAGRRG
jgi:CheY-like chemotaxis protein